MNDITLNNTNDVLKEIEDAYYDIPFGNTAFQTEMFVISAQITPARMYRTVGLHLNSMLKELQNLKHQQEKYQIDMEEYEYQKQSGELSLFDIKRKEADLKHAEFYKREAQKNLNDTLVQLNIFYKYFKQFPKYTREQFEKQEKIYFEQSLRRQILGLSGAKEAIMNMVDDSNTLETFNNLYNELSNENKEKLLLDITKQSLAGYIGLEEEKQK